MPIKQPKKILVVEDDQQTRDMLYTFLTYQGFSVHTACHGVEGYEALGRGEFLRCEVTRIAYVVANPQKNGN